VEAGTLTAAQAEQLSQFYAQVNAAYFSGRLDRLQTLWDETLYEQWQQTGAFPGLYLQSIRDEARVDHTQWSGEV
jgi:hypothetical protein